MTEQNYIDQLNPMEQKVLNIARSHLETSFSLEKSIGFQEWQQKIAQPPIRAESEPPAVIIKRKPKIKISSRTKILSV